MPRTTVEIGFQQTKPKKTFSTVVKKSKVSVDVPVVKKRAATNRILTKPNRVKLERVQLLEMSPVKFREITPKKINFKIVEVPKKARFSIPGKPLKVKL